MYRLFSFFSFGSSSVTHWAWLFPLSEGQGGFPADAYAGGEMLAFFPTLPPQSLHPGKPGNRNTTQSLQNLLCANSKGGVRVLVGGWKRDLSLGKCSQGKSLSPWILFTMPRVWPRGLSSHCWREKKPRAHSSQDCTWENCCVGTCCFRMQPEFVSGLCTFPEQHGTEAPEWR